MSIMLILLSIWTFHSAPLAKDPTTGHEISTSIHTLTLPSAAACGWWKTSLPVIAGNGVHFSATAKIQMRDHTDSPWNDVMMFVRFMKDDGGLFQADFVKYTDRVINGEILRSFDEIFSVPNDCHQIKVEFIAKWHPLTATITNLKAETCQRPQPRKVRCVVGNPYESTGFAILNKMRKNGQHLSIEDVFAVRLGQIEQTLTNIFAHVEKPDIILFSECFSGQGAENPAQVAEKIPGGPSWQLAERYARRYECNIAMNVKERDEHGECYNTLFVVDRNGNLAGRYRKCHLTSGEYQQGLIPGNSFPIFNLDFGRVGALICWDNWFSESIKLVKREGAELLLFPLAGCTQDHVDICFPARAIDSGLPIMVAMRQGHLPNGIIDRDGKWIAKTMVDNGFAVADIDLNERKRTYWLSVGPGDGDPYELYYDESRPAIYHHFNYNNGERK